MVKYVKAWLLLMLAGVFTAGCVYGAAQQCVRQSANLPAAGAARQVIFELEKGAQPVDICNSMPDLLPLWNLGINAAGKTNVALSDISLSYSPFVMIFDGSKTLLASSGQLGDNPPSYPVGSLEAADNATGMNRVTWQTIYDRSLQPGGGKSLILRYATVVYKWTSGTGDMYIVGAMPLTEYEATIGSMTRLLLYGSLAYAVLCALILWIASLIIGMSERRKAREIDKTDIPKISIDETAKPEEAEAVTDET